jgi:DNA topoisomerase-1
MATRNSITSADLQKLYNDNHHFAETIGLIYCSDDMPGYKRIKYGKSFRYVSTENKSVDSVTKKRLDELVVPPGWKDVWFFEDPKGHILATGIDKRNRKQYIYNPKWRIMRDLIKFYRMIFFGESLPKIRQTINQNLNKQDLCFDRVIAAMLWILDNTYIRVGNDIYYRDNESVGLTTLTDENVVISGSVVTLAFKAKSGKERELVIDHPVIAQLIKASRDLYGDRLFQYLDGSGHHAITATHVNSYLRQITNQPITAKDFRTWGGTLLAFNHLIENRNTDKKPEKLVVEATDAAADVLGNTRTVARSSYIHPHILEAYGSKNFDKYYRQAQATRRISGLDKRESDLLVFLKELFEAEFSLLKEL